MKKLLKISVVIVVIFFYSSCTQENFEFEETTCEIHNYEGLGSCEGDHNDVLNDGIISTIGEDGSVIEEDDED